MVGIVGKVGSELHYLLITAPSRHYYVTITAPIKTPSWHHHGTDHGTITAWNHGFWPKNYLKCPCVTPKYHILGKSTFFVEMLSDFLVFDFSFSDFWRFPRNSYFQHYSRQSRHHPTFPLCLFSNLENKSWISAIRFKQLESTLSAAVLIPLTCCFNSTSKTKASTNNVPQSAHTLQW